MIKYLFFIAAMALCQMAYSAEPMPINDLRIEFSGENPNSRDLTLTWSSPLEDTNGSPIEIEGYNVYLCVEPYCTFEEGYLLAQTADTSYLFEDPDIWFPRACFRVTTLGTTVAVPPDMTSVPAGTFIMGQEETNGVPVHEVTLTNDFYVSTHEITNEEYRSGLQWACDEGLLQLVSQSTVAAHDRILIQLNAAGCEIAWNGSSFVLEAVHSGLYEGLNAAHHPVLEVSWYGAACFCDWLSLQQGLTPFYNGNWTVSSDHNPYEAEGYRLLTEAEWEYVSRYSDNRIYPWGDAAPDCELVNFNPGDPCVGWTAPVGSHSAGNSALGITDLAGNLWEWVNDYWGDYSESPAEDPIGPGFHSLDYRSFRGGSWYYGEERLPSAHRNFNDAANTRNYLSFRIARTVSAE